jgi:hypothetical protein
MQHKTDALIAELVGDLEPVRPLRFAEGLALALAATGLSAAVVVWLFGMRADLMAGSVNPMHLVTTGLFFVLGLAASVTVVVMSRPHVGSDHGGWRWAAGMAALLPVTGLIVALSRGTDVMSAESMSHGADCFAIGGAASLLVFAALTAWLRRGAPTAPDRAGLVAGVAAGAFGIAAFSLHCPDNDIVHIGVWHSAVVLAMAGLGRLAVPHLVRW